MKRKERSNFLKQICRKIGISPDRIVDTNLHFDPVQLSRNCRVEIVSGTITFLSPQGGPMIFTIQPEFTCPTCKSILREPQKQMVGITECCGLIYCSHPICKPQYGNCAYCNEPVCHLCGLKLPGFHRNMMVHKEYCYRRVDRMIRRGISKRILLPAPSYVRKQRRRR